MNTTLRLCIAAATVCLVTACGGGGSDSAPTPTPPATAEPDSAATSVRAYTDFTAQVIASTVNIETAAPLMLSAASAPLSETDSPLPVD